jgi:hypothetical protein
MKTRLACAALLVMLSLAAPAVPQSCPAEDPTILCGFYCWNFECWGPALPTSGCIANPGCISVDNAPACSCGGGF